MQEEEKYKPLFGRKWFMKNDKGFSLIELIIVIAIMAILVAVITPNLTKYLADSKKKADETNINTIKSTVEQACALSGTMVTEPDSSKNGQWVTLVEDSAYFDSNAANVGGKKAFSRFVAEELSNKIPVSKQTGNYFQVKITGSSGNRYIVEVETQ